MTERLQLLGPFSLIDADGTAVPFASPRAQALVAYLALRAGAPESRRRVSFLLWPDSSEAQARNSLRQLLHQVRRAWPAAGRFLVTDASSVTLVTGAGLAVDVAEYEAAVAAAGAIDERGDGRQARAALELAAGLYHGDLLPGSYDDWVIPVRDRLLAGHERTLDRLIALLEGEGDYRAAIEHGERRLRLDPLDERMYRRLMRLHALDQDRAGALRVYQECQTALDRELGVEPEPATVLAYEQIRRLGDGSAGDAPPDAGRAEDGPAPAGAADAVLPALIGRRTEWSRAMAAWHGAAAGNASLLLIAGEAGIGKSRLAAELVAWTGSLGIRSATTRAYAAEGRLSFGPLADWLHRPALASSLPRLDSGALSEIARILPDILVQRPDVPRPSGRVEDWQRRAFFEALAGAFRVGGAPLLLVLDDLQWCDPDTLAWLHFLLRLDRRAPLLVTGTVRPEEVDRGHPLGGLTADLRATGQLVEIALGPLDAAETAGLAAQVAGRRLRPREERAIMDETEGNPLFVVETVRAGLADPRDGDGGPVGFGPTPDAVTGPGRGLPARILAVIEARLGQLSDPAREMASVAATIGRAFSADIVALAGEYDDRTLVTGLDELLRRQVVREQGGGAFDFAHDRIREVAYGATSEAHRRVLHRRVAAALEHIHGATLDVVAAQVAAHLVQAGQVDRAAGFYQLAAEVEQRVGANLGAIALLRRALGLLDALPPSPDRDARELDLLTVLGVSLVATEGYGAPEAAEAYLRCRQLCQVLGRPPSPPILRALALMSLAQARIDDCHALGDHLLSIAEQADDPVLRVEAHYVIAMSLLLTGAAVPARMELEASLAHYDRARSSTHVARYSQDPAVVCLIRLSLAEWILGDTRGSARRRSESLALAAELGHPFTLGYALTWDAILQCFRGDAALATAQADAAIALGRDHRMPFWLSIATIVRGWAAAMHGDVAGGIEGIRTGMADFKATGSLFLRPFQLGLLAELHGRIGNVERGLTLVTEALAAVERTNERWCEPELYRRRGGLHALALDTEAAEAALRRAIDVAHYQQARSLELRAAVDLAELWAGHGRDTEVARLLAPIVAALADAADLPELVRARALFGRARPGPRSRAGLTPS